MRDDDDFAETALDPIAVNVRLEPEPPVREPAMRDAPQSATPSSGRVRPAPEASSPALAGEPDGASTRVLPWRAREGEGAVDDDAGMTELDRDAYAPFQPPQIRGGWSDAPSHGAGASPERATPRRVLPPRRVPDSDLGLKLALGGLVALIVILVVVIVAGLVSTGDGVPAESTTEASE